MAALIWTDWNNGDSNLLLRGNLNTFNNSVVTNVNKNTTDIVTIDGKADTNSTDIAALDVRTTQAEADIVVLESPDSILFTPQVSPPSYTEGQVYYDAAIGTTNIQGAYPTTTLQVGREMHMEVINNTVGTIFNGTPVRHNGVVGGEIQIVPAQADTFINATVMGMATHDILSGEKGIITTFGYVGDMDTSLLAVGAPIYLSDTVAGGLTATAPDIATQVGGSILSGVTGTFFVSIRNTINPPVTIAALEGQTVGVYNVIATPQNIIDYADSGNIVMGVNPVLGSITPVLDGFYRLSFNVSMSFPTATSTRVVDFEIWNSTDGLSLGAYHANIPRDTTQNSLSFSPAISLLADKAYVVRISGDTIALTLDEVTFDIASLHIR